MTPHDGTDLPPGALGSDERVESAHALALAPLPQHVRSAREFIGSQAQHLPEDERDVLALLASELVTNVVIHARTDFIVTLVLTPVSVVVAIYDEDLGRREVPTESPRDGGRGLVLVDSLSADWGVHHHRGGGKSVWFRLDRQEAGDVAQEGRSR